MLFWSIFFIIIIISFQQYYNNIIIFLLLIIFYLNFFGYTNKLFHNYTPIIQRSVKEIFITNIYITSGFVLGKINILGKSHFIKSKIISISLIIIFLIKSSIYAKRLDCISTQSTITVIFLFFSHFPFDFIKNANIIAIFKQITNFTG